MDPVRRIFRVHGRCEEVRQLDDKRLHWVASVAGKRYEWDAEIYEQVPDQRIAWRVTSGKRHEGLVTFEKTSDEHTRVNVRVAYEPEGVMEKTGDALGVATARVKGDLKRFKNSSKAAVMKAARGAARFMGKRSRGKLAMRRVPSVCSVNKAAPAARRPAGKRGCERSQQERGHLVRLAPIASCWRGGGRLEIDDC
jgi:hypothetical protein